MRLTVDEELLFAPHALKASTLVASEPEAEDAMTISQCQICLDDLANDAVITAFCSESCSAVLCRSCLNEHIRISVAAAFPGVLPKVRCPICLVRVNKAKWEHIVSPDVVTQYKQACRTACSFQTPCCHNAQYTHLPIAVGATDRPSKYIDPAPLPASLEDQLDELHDRTRRFSNFEITAKDVMIYVEETFGRDMKLKTQHLVMEHELPTIADEERRATLLLAYHAKYKVVKTRCCGIRTCFNCKRKIVTHPTGGCDDAALQEACVIECRSCHVTMVKVEGCNAVRCWCGYQMDWQNEVRIRDRNVKYMIPVDIYDFKTYDVWVAWEQKLARVLKTELVPSRQKLRLQRIDQLLLTATGLQRTMRGFLHRLIYRQRFARMLKTLEMCVVDYRAKRCIARLKRARAFVEAVRRAKWRVQWKRVVKQVHTKQFWSSYEQYYADAQRELDVERGLFLLPGLALTL